MLLRFAAVFTAVSAAAFSLAPFPAHGAVRACPSRLELMVDDLDNRVVFFDLQQSPGRVARGKESDFEGVRALGDRLKAEATKCTENGNVYGFVRDLQHDVTVGAKFTGPRYGRVSQLAIVGGIANVDWIPAINLTNWSLPRSIYPRASVAALREKWLGISPIDNGHNWAMYVATSDANIFVEYMTGKSTVRNIFFYFGN